MLVLHTFGADLKWNPHIHVIITCGGLSTRGDRWIKNQYIPQNVIRPMYRYIFLQQIKRLFKKGKLKPPPTHRAIKTYKTFNSWLTQFYRMEWYLHLGKTLQESASTIRYVGRYGKRPVLAESRIEAFDGRSITFSYKDRATGENASLTLPIPEFIGRLVLHIPDQHYRTLRHAGLFANRVRTELLAKAHRALAQAPKPKPPRVSWRELYWKTFDRDPLDCPNCGATMELIHVTFVKTSDIRNRVETRHRERESRHHAAQKKAQDQRRKPMDRRPSSAPATARASP
jgi:hypothetical protein